MGEQGVGIMMMIAIIICEDLFLVNTSGSIPCYFFCSKCHSFCSLERYQISDYQVFCCQVPCIIATSRITFAGIVVVPFVLGIVTCPVSCTIEPMRTDSSVTHYPLSLSPQTSPYWMAKHLLEITPLHFCTLRHQSSSEQLQ